MSSVLCVLFVMKSHRWKTRCWQVKNTKSKINQNFISHHLRHPHIRHPHSHQYCRLTKCVAVKTKNSKWFSESIPKNSSEFFGKKNSRKGNDANKLCGNTKFNIKYYFKERLNFSLENGFKKSSVHSNSVKHYERCQQLILCTMSSTKKWQHSTSSKHVLDVFQMAIDTWFG